jgi:hypothetical protein
MSFGTHNLIVRGDQVLAVPRPQINDFIHRS